MKSGSCKSSYRCAKLAGLDTLSRLGLAYLTHIHLIFSLSSACRSLFLPNFAILWRFPPMSRQRYPSQSINSIFDAAPVQTLFCPQSKRRRYRCLKFCNVYVIQKALNPQISIHDIRVQSKEILCNPTQARVVATEGCDKYCGFATVVEFVVNAAQRENRPFILIDDCSEFSIYPFLLNEPGFDIPS